MSRLPAAERREQLLDTAATLFARHGYAGATTSQIARAAGVTEPIIYRHFASKRELFVALIERTGDRTLEMWEKSLEPIKDPADRLATLIGANPMVSAVGRDDYRVVVQAMTKADDPAIRAALNSHLVKLHAFVAEQVELAQQAGHVSPRFSPPLSAWAMIQLGLGYGMLAGCRISGQGVDAAGMHVQELLGQLMLGERYHKPDESA